MQAAEHDRRGNDEIAARRAVFARRRALGFANVFEDALAGGDVRTPGFGEGEATAGAVDQPGLEMRLKLGTFRLTVASGIPSAREAAERLPPSTAASSVAMDSRRSIMLPLFGRLSL